MTMILSLSHESSHSTSYKAVTSNVGGTATRGTDYESFLVGGEARITVQPGDTQANLDITITDDTDSESDETITIHWENDATGGNGEATPTSIDFTGTIIDNDDNSDSALSGLAVNDGTSDLTLTPGFASGTHVYTAEVENDITSVTLTATPNHADAEVSSVTLGGTAIADTDFSDGITVPDMAEGDNEIVVTVTAEDGSTQTYTVTLTRHTTPPEITFGSDTTTAFEGTGNTVHFGIGISHPSTKTITLDYAAQDGTAEGDLDYQRAGSFGTLTFEPGHSGGAIVFYIIWG